MDDEECLGIHRRTPPWNPFEIASRRTQGKQPVSGIETRAKQFRTISSGKHDNSHDEDRDVSGIIVKSKVGVRDFDRV